MRTWNNWSHISQTQQMVWPLWKAIEQFIKLTDQPLFGNLIPKKLSKKICPYTDLQGGGGGQAGSLVVKTSTPHTSACIQLKFLSAASDSTFLFEAMIMAQVVGFPPTCPTPGLGFTLLALEVF